MPQRPSGPKRKAPARMRKKQRREAASSTTSAQNLFAFTVDATTGQVVTVEALGAGGTRRKVSDRQRKTLERVGRERLESVVEEAFEAGIDCVLGDSEEPLEVVDERDAELRHALVAPLLQRSSVGRRLKSEVLGRAVLGSLIQNSIDPAGHPARTP